MHFVLIALISALPLSCGELLTRIFRLEREAARKLVHVLGGLAAAGLAGLYELNDISLVVGSFTLVMFVVRWTMARHVHSLYAVDRTSYGEIWFPLGVALGALLAPSMEAYVAAMLILGFADTAASVIGLRLPRRCYQVWGCNKTVAGSLAFAAVAYLSCLPVGVPTGQMVVVVLAATLAEALGGYGSDNLLVPLAVVLVW